MPGGAGLGTVVTALLPLVGIVTILTARRRRSNGKSAPDPEAERWQTSRLETDRRMAAYLASRDAGRSGAFDEDIEQETRR